MCGSATQLFATKFTNKGMSVQFPRVVRGLPPARSLASLIGKGASATAPGYRHSLAKRSFGSIGLEVGGT